MRRPRARNACLFGTDRNADAGTVEQSSQVYDRATVAATDVQDSLATTQIQPLHAVFQHADLSIFRLVVPIEEQSVVDVVAPEGLIDQSQGVVMLADLGGKGGVKVSRFQGVTVSRCRGSKVARAHSASRI